jgi:hypothetical protein
MKCRWVDISGVCCLLINSAVAQTARNQPVGPSEPTARIKIVAGVVSEGGTVRFLPRVSVRLMPKAYSEAERAATDAYSAEIQSLRQTRDATIKKLVEGRRNELAAIKGTYDTEFQRAIQDVTMDPFTAAPDCLMYARYINKVEGPCDQKYAIGNKVSFSPQLRRLLVHPAIIGAFDVRSYKPEDTPLVRNRQAALAAIPLERYQQVPEFSKEVEKAVGKERDRAKLKRTQPLTSEVSKAAVVRFCDEWSKAARGGYSDPLRRFGGVRPDFFDASANLLQAAAKRAVKAATDKPLSAYVSSKDTTNAKYDARQAEADAIFKRGADAAEKRRAAALDAAVTRTPPVQETTTSLQGEAILTVPPGEFAIVAEDTTTDQHLRWSIPVPRDRASAPTVELTDANALKATPTTIASAASQFTYPKAASLSETERAEYNLRYGSRLSKSWTSATVLHDAVPEGDDLDLLDSQLGFAFQVRAESTSVFNTLRMTDNDMAARFFKEIVAPYLQVLPADLRTTGGSQAFEAVSLRITGRKRSFAEEYAVGDRFVLTYAFRVADVESYAGQKIDAQQLLDRSHITHDLIGRISVKLVAAQ